MKGNGSHIKCQIIIITRTIIKKTTQKQKKYKKKTNKNLDNEMYEAERAHTITLLAAILPKSFTIRQRIITHVVTKVLLFPGS